MTQPEKRTILLGINYLPHVTCVEDFSPYWITDNWTERRMVADLKIMKAIGCSFIRIHIYPAMPGKSTVPGVDAEKFLPMLDLAVETCRDIGLAIHFDICQDVDEYGEEGTKFYLNRYKGRIESYQFGNERYEWPRDPEKLKWLQKLAELAHTIDPDAKVSADMLVPDWVKIRDEMPDLYRQLDMCLAHYYAVTDYHGWNEIYTADLVDHLSNPTGRKSVTILSYEQDTSLKEFGDYDRKAHSYDHPFYAGSWAWLDKEVWITEITTHGYWCWGNVTPEERRVTGWPKVVDAVASAPNRLTRIGHHCFRDKMSWREYGAGQCGIVYYDGAPRPVTRTWRELAVKYSPPDSPLRALECEIPRVVVLDGATKVDLEITLTNKTDASLSGEASLELPAGASAEESAFGFSLAPNAAQVWRTQVAVEALPCGNNHVFVRVKIPQGLIYGWGIIARPKRVTVDTTPNLVPELSSKVRYARGFEAVQEFLDKYADDCAIVIGPGQGMDAEIGYRLKTVLQAMRCCEIPVRSSIQAAEVLHKPFICVGTPEFNLVSRTVEMCIAEDQRITMENPGPGNGVINVIEAPLGEMSVNGRGSRQARQLGYFFGSCPAALYIAGPDDAGTQAAGYDLISRIWGSERRYE